MAPDEVGRQPWIVQGLLKTSDASSSVGTWTIALASPCSCRCISCSGSRFRVHAPMRARTRRPPGQRRRRGPPTRNGVLSEPGDALVLVVAFFWAGYLMLEGFDFGVGILLPFVGRGEHDRGEMLETIAPVSDGNEVWLVVAGGATWRRSRPGTPPCSRAYVAPLGARPADGWCAVVEWRERDESSRWAACGSGRTSSPASARHSCRESRLPTWCRVCRSTPMGTMRRAGQPVQPVHRDGRPRRRGPLRDARRDDPDATDDRSAPAAGDERRTPLSWPAVALATILLAWTVVVATNANQKSACLLRWSPALRSWPSPPAPS